MSRVEVGAAVQHILEFIDAETGKPMSLSDAKAVLDQLETEIGFRIDGIKDDMINQGITDDEG